MRSHCGHSFMFDVLVLESRLKDSFFVRLEVYIVPGLPERVDNSARFQLTFISILCAIHIGLVALLYEPVSHAHAGTGGQNQRSSKALETVPWTKGLISASRLLERRWVILLTKVLLQIENYEDMRLNSTRLLQRTTEMRNEYNNIQKRRPLTMKNAQTHFNPLHHYQDNSCNQSPLSFSMVSTAAPLSPAICAIPPFSWVIIRGVHLIVFLTKWRRNSTERGGGEFHSVQSVVSSVEDRSRISLLYREMFVSTRKIWIYYFLFTSSFLFL